MRSNRRPKQDPGFIESKQERAKKPSEKKKQLEKNSRTRRDAGKKSKKGKQKKQKKQKKPKKGRKSERNEEDESSKRTAVIWPWLTSITVSGSTVCPGYIVSPRQSCWRPLYS